MTSLREYAGYHGGFGGQLRAWDPPSESVDAALLPNFTRGNTRGNACAIWYAPTPSAAQISRRALSTTPAAPGDRRSLRLFPAKAWWHLPRMLSENARLRR